MTFPRAWSAHRSWLNALDFRKHKKHWPCFVLFPGVSFSIKCWKCHGLEELFPWLCVTKQQDVFRHPSPWSLAPRKSFAFPGRPALMNAAGSAPEKFPVETFLGLPTLGFTFHTQKLGTLCLPKHAVTCANGYYWFSVIWLVPATLPFKSPYPPIFPSTETLNLGCSWSQPGIPIPMWAEGADTAL